MEHKPFKLFHQPAGQRLSSQPLHALSEEQEGVPEEHAGGEQWTPSSTPQESSEEASSSMLREMAQITAQSFQSSQEAMRVALEVLGRFLDCQTLFVARFSVSEPEAIFDAYSERYTLKIIEAYNRGTSLPAVGSEGALKRTYCQMILRTKRPLIVEDVTREPFYQRLETTREYDIGSYIGVPLIYSDGRVYGTLCSQDPRPRPLAEQPEKLELMQIVARFLISHIEREELTIQLRAAEHAQAELARRERQARAEADRRVHELEAIFEAMGDGLLVSDQRGHLQMNAVARRLLPLLPHDNMESLMEKQEEDTLIRDEDGLPIALEDRPIKRVMRGEHLIGPKVVNIQQINAQGEKRYLNISGMPIYDQQEQVNGCVLVFRDVTEHYLLERRTHDTLNALLALAESLASLPENASACFSATPSTQAPSLWFTCQHVRQLIATSLHCQDIGLLSLETETEPWQLLTKTDPSQAHESPWWQDARRILASSQGLDINHLRKNEIVTHSLPPQGETDTPLLVEAPMFLGNRLLGALVLIYTHHDGKLAPTECNQAKAVAKLTGLLHERERLLQEQAEARAQTLALQETNRRFNEFLSIASHELKGPLMGIQGNIQLAQRTLRALASQERQEPAAVSSVLEKLPRYLERARHQVRVQDRLTSDLLDVSRIRAGKLELQMQPCNLGEIVCGIVEDQRQAMEGRTINLALPEEHIHIDGDAERLGQVVNNYLTNALKYSSPEKPVEVTVTADDNVVRVTVCDQGPGLAPEEQQRIWDRFYRAKGVQVQSGTGIGLGLGLHICKTIIEQHGGRVGLESTPGKGSHFWFTLPLNADRSFS